MYDLFRQPTFVQTQVVPEPSVFLIDKFQFLWCCVLPDFVMSDFVFPRDAEYLSLKFVMCCSQLLLCDREKPQFLTVEHC